MIRRNRDVNRPNFNQSNPECANRRASYLKTNLAHAFRAMAPALFALTFASVAESFIEIPCTELPKGGVPRSAVAKARIRA